MIKCSVKNDIRIQKELLKTADLISIINFIIGTLGLMAFMGLYVLSNMKWIFFLLIFAIPFMVGLFLMILVNKSYKMVMEKNTIDYYEFYEGFLIVTTVENNENMSVAKMYYKDLSQIKERKDYMFLFFKNGLIFTILKSALPPQDLSSIRMMLNFPKTR